MAVELGVGREFFEAVDAGDVFGPAGDAAEHGLGGGEVFAAAGEVFGDGAADVVGFADIEFVEAGEYIKEGDRDGVDATDAGAVASGDGVEPAAAARASGDCSEFVSGDANAVADVVIEF